MRWSRPLTALQAVAAGPALRGGAGPAEPARSVSIEPAGRRPRLRLKEVWDARELLLFLTWRDVKVRYKQTALGASWAVLQPVATAVVFTVVFGRLADVPSDGVPYPIFALAALVPWTFMSGAIGLGSNSLVNNLSMITKVYVPRLVLPVSACLAAMLDLVIATAVLLALSLAYGLTPSLRLALLPVLAVLALVTVVGISLFLSAVNLRFRDIRYVLPFLLQLGLFVSPVAYSSRLLDEQARLAYALNPAVGVIDGFRWAVLGTSDDRLPLVLATSTASALVLSVLGLRYFRRREAAFADVA